MIYGSSTRDLNITFGSRNGSVHVVLKKSVRINSFNENSSFFKIEFSTKSTDRHIYTKGFSAKIALMSDYIGRQIPPGIYPWHLPVFPCMTNKAHVFVLFCCFTSQVKNYIVIGVGCGGWGVGGGGRADSSPNHTFFLGKLEQAVNHYFLHILSLVTNNNPS